MKAQHQSAQYKENVGMLELVGLQTHKCLLALHAVRFLHAFFLLKCWVTWECCSATIHFPHGWQNRIVPSLKTSPNSATPWLILTLQKMGVDELCQSSTSWGQPPLATPGDMKTPRNRTFKSFKIQRLSVVPNHLLCYLPYVLIGHPEGISWRDKTCACTWMVGHLAAMSVGLFITGDANMSRDSQT